MSSRSISCARTWERRRYTCHLLYVTRSSSLGHSIEILKSTWLLLFSSKTQYTETGPRLRPCSAPQSHGSHGTYTHEDRDTRERHLVNLLHGTLVFTPTALIFTPTAARSRGRGPGCTCHPGAVRHVPYRAAHRKRATGNLPQQTAGGTPAAILLYPHPIAFYTNAF